MKIFLHAIIISSLLFQTIEAAAIRGKARLRKKGSFPERNPYVNNTFRIDLRFKLAHPAEIENAQLKNYDDPSETIIYLSKFQIDTKGKKFQNRSQFRYILRELSFTQGQFL